MKFSFAHNNINVKDLDKSLAFYKEALLLEESRRLEDPSGAFTLVYLNKEMDVVAYENADMGIYFIADPDGYWTEIIPAGKY